LKKKGEAAVSEITRQKLSLVTARYKKKNNKQCLEALANIKAKTTEREGVAVSVLKTQTNEVFKFESQTDAAKFMGITRQAVYKAIKRNSVVNGLYKVAKI